MQKIFLLLLLLPLSTHAQLEKVLVETYYVSDSIDATDTNGGYLKPGSVTYRIYVDLVAGSRLISLYGDTNHALKFASTDTFFNNIADGQTFAKEFSKNRYSEGTVALDTWITLGQTTRNGSKTYFGTPKNLDDDGSFIGGANNDGGSAGITTGLLTNTASAIPLTTSDGMDTMSVVPSLWGDYGFLDISSGEDSTIFGSIVSGTSFTSYNAGLLNSGIGGVNTDSNMVLVAQLTTTGTISFEINLVVIDTAGNAINYVANDSILLGNEVLSRYLKYPYSPVCGCADPTYLEYLPNRDCDENDSCKTIIVFGCMDTAACNYNAGANYHVQSLCCYPGYCNDRNLAVVCPQLQNERLQENEMTITPNPANEKLYININSKQPQTVFYEIADAFGRKVLEGRTRYGETTHAVNCSEIIKGVYFIKVTGSISWQSSFIKN